MSEQGEPLNVSKAMDVALAKFLQDNEGEPIPRQLGYIVHRNGEVTVTIEPDAPSLTILA